jgi:hypothetical protein
MINFVCAKSQGFRKYLLSDISSKIQPLLKVVFIEGLKTEKFPSNPRSIPPQPENNENTCFGSMTPKYLCPSLGPYNLG